MIGVVLSACRGYMVGSMLRRCSMVRLLIGNPLFRIGSHWVGIGLMNIISVYRRCGGGE